MKTVILKRFENPMQAHILKGLLESHGIFCFLQDEHSISINPLYANALGGIKLIINAADEEEAMKLLEQNKE